MPPMLSDDESASDNVPDMIPARGKAKAASEPVEAEVEEEAEEDDAEEDEYRVEKILKHDFQDDGTVLYQIKWLGYDDAADLTWEPIENLSGAKDILKAYHKKIGGEPVYEPKSKSSKKKGGRTSTGGKRSASDAFADSPAPAASSSKKKSRKSNGIAATTADEEPSKRILPQGSWDGEVLRVTSIIEESVPVKVDAKGREKEEKELIGLLEWKDGPPKTQHKMKVLRQKVPQRLLDYYEQHLVFTHTTDEFKEEEELAKMDEALEI